MPYYLQKIGACHSPRGLQIFGRFEFSFFYGVLNPTEDTIPEFITTHHPHPYTPNSAA